MRLRTQLLILVLALLAAACLAIGLVSRAVMSSSLTEQVDAQLAGASRRAAMWGGPQGQGRGPRHPLDACGQAVGTVSVRFEGAVATASGIIDPDGARVALEDKDIAILNAVPLSPGSTDLTPVTVDLSSGRYRAASVPAPVLPRVSPALPTSDPAAATRTRVVTALPLSERDAALADLTRILLLVSLLSLAGAGVIGAWLVRRAMRPVETVSAVALQVAHQPLASGAVELSERVPLAAADPRTEIGAVGAALNHLLDNVDAALTMRHRSETQVRQFVADASHELRTPLASISGYAEMLRLSEPLSESGTTSLARVESQARRMASLVEELLLLARLDEGLVAERREVDLVELVLDAVADARAAHPDHSWRVAVPDGPVIRVADPRQMTQVITNLLANAARHSGAGSVIDARVLPGEVVMEVEDNGPGIDPALLPHVFDRFARGDRARSQGEGSTGLGLAIVAAIARAHGGSVQVDSVPGRTIFRLALPG